MASDEEKVARPKPWVTFCGISMKVRGKISIFGFKLRNLHRIANVMEWWWMIKCIHLFVVKRSNYLSDKCSLHLDHYQTLRMTACTLRSSSSSQNKRRLLGKISQNRTCLGIMIKILHGFFKPVVDPDSLLNLDLLHCEFKFSIRNLTRPYLVS